MPVRDQDWQEIPIDTKMFLNVDEASLTEALAAVENAFITQAGGHKRFPGLNEVVDLIGAAPVYLESWRGDMIAVSGDGYVFRINKALNAENVTGVPVSGGKRVIFAKSEEELMAAAGGEIIRFAGGKTEILAENAPLSTHIAFIDGYALATEAASNLFFHSLLTQARVWDSLDVFAANSNPDRADALLVTPFREVLVAGEESIEQYERLSTGDVPFFRRWAVGQGIRSPYTLTFVDDAAWAINKLFEFVRFSGQTSRPHSDDIGKFLESLDDWADAWTTPLHILGQKFIVLQIPYATNRHGLAGVTLLYDYAQKRWSELYGWDDGLNRPARWPGWSHLEIWGRHFVGGDGKIFELDPATFSNDAKVQRMLIRTAHFSEGNEVRLDNLRLKLRRGTGTNVNEGHIRIRVNKNNRGFGRWQQKPIGKRGDVAFFVEFGNFGKADSFQYEIETTDAFDAEILALERKITRLR